MTNTMGGAGAAASGQPYSLTVLNQNSLFQHFAMFQTLPQLIGPSVNPLTLAWILGAAAPGTPDNPSQSVFSWQVVYSAATGYVQTMGMGVNQRRFTTQTSTGVDVSNSNSVPVTYMGVYPQGVPAFGAAPSTGAPGLVTMLADNTIPTQAQQTATHSMLSLGLAMDNRPAVAVELLPNLTYQFTPKPNYYIIAGSFQQGQVIDVSMMANAFQVQFDGVTDQTVTFTPSNTFVLSN